LLVKLDCLQIDIRLVWRGNSDSPDFIPRRDSRGIEVASRIDQEIPGCRENSGGLIDRVAFPDAAEVKT